MSLLSISVANGNESLSGSASSVANDTCTSSNSGSNSKGGTAVHKHAGAERRATMSSNSAASCPSNNPDLITQRAILEQLLGDKRLLEGEFWYVIVAEWLEQLKRYLGIQSTRKYYHQRAHPGPIITRRDYAHTVDVVHEDGWKMLVMWYGLAEGHKAIKLVVYRYSPSRAPEIEHNLNSFKVSMSNASPEEFHNIRFSKMDKVGHAEFKIREIYGVPKEQQTRLWGRPDADTSWRPMFSREKHVGKVLDIDSDFTRPNVALEVCNPEGLWVNRPDSENTEQNLDFASGPLYPHNIFEDVTTTWELDIHEQIEHIGKNFLEHLHTNFNAFIQRAKDYMDERDYRLRETERDVNSRETYVDSLHRKLRDKEEQLNAELTACERKIKEYEGRRQELERECVAKKEDLEKAMLLRREDLERDIRSFKKEKDSFDTELKVNLRNWITI